MWRKAKTEIREYAPDDREPIDPPPIISVSSDIEGFFNHGANESVTLRLSEPLDC
jgi:hypothetical protein